MSTTSSSSLDPLAGEKNLLRRSRRLAAKKPEISEEEIPPPSGDPSTRAPKKRGKEIRLSSGDPSTRAPKKRGKEIRPSSADPSIPGSEEPMLSFNPSPAVYSPAASLRPGSFGRLMINCYDSELADYMDEHPCPCCGGEMPE